MYNRFDLSGSRVGGTVSVNLTCFLLWMALLGLPVSSISRWRSRCQCPPIIASLLPEAIPGPVSSLGVLWFSFRPCGISLCAAHSLLIISQVSSVPRTIYLECHKKHNHVPDSSEPLPGDHMVLHLQRPLKVAGLLQPLLGPWVLSSNYGKCSWWEKLCCWSSAPA